MGEDRDLETGVTQCIYLPIEYSMTSYTGIGYDMHDIVHMYMYDVTATHILPLTKVFVMQLPHRGTSRQDKWTAGYQLK